MPLGSFLTLWMEGLMPDEAGMLRSDIEQIAIERDENIAQLWRRFTHEQDARRAVEAELERLHSWAGLMSLLDEHWPDAVFRGSSGDPGPTIVFLLRQIDRLREEVDRLHREVEFEAKAEPWKSSSVVAPLGHGHVNGGCVCECGHPCRSLGDWIRHVEAMTPCACITDEQASQLGPRFSRPACAVHPEVE